MGKEKPQGKFDIVFVDAPCSGSGTWRRSPDQRFALTREKLATYIAAQSELLAEGATLVKPGGRLVYITCSLFLAEAEDQITAFRKAHPGWRALVYRGILQGRGLKVLPESGSALKDCLLLTPGAHGSDGFFVAILEKL